MHSHFDISNVNWSIRVNKFGNTCDLLSRILKLSLMVHFTLNQGLVTSAHNYSFSSGIHGFHVKLLVAGALYLLKGRFRERPLNIFSSLSLWDLRRQGCEHSVAISLHGINILIRELSVYLALILFLSGYEFARVVRLINQRVILVMRLVSRSLDFFWHGTWVGRIIIPLELTSIGNISSLSHELRRIIVRIDVYFGVLLTLRLFRPVAL